MSRHFNEMRKHVPNFDMARMLDLGSGRGAMLVEAKQRGLNMVGLELSPGYIRITHERAKNAGVTVEVTQGVAERMPFADEQFDFINCAEVIEHVEDPDAVFKEIFRVLRPEGKVYLSVPSRFGIYDPHYHLFFVNWLPRAWSEFFISLFGKNKDDSRTAGKQRLNEMYYDTVGGVKKRAEQHGFTCTDIRLHRIQTEMSMATRPFAVACYLIVRPFAFQAHHILLGK